MSDSDLETSSSDSNASSSDSDFSDAIYEGESKTNENINNVFSKMFFQK